jgi:hypothetical protein
MHLQTCIRSKLPVILLALFSFTPLQPETVEPSEMIYIAYTRGKIELWTEAMANTGRELQAHWKH